MGYFFIHLLLRESLVFSQFRNGTIYSIPPHYQSYTLIRINWYRNLFSYLIEFILIPPDDMSCCSKRVSFMIIAITVWFCQIYLIYCSQRLARFSWQGIESTADLFYCSRDRTNISSYY